MSKSLAWLFRLGCFGFVLIVIVGTAVLLGMRRYAMISGLSELVEGGDPGLNPAERIFLQTYLSSHADELEESVGDGNRPVTFTIVPGESADTIAADLAKEDMLKEPQLFTRYVRYHGLDSQLEAGEFVLSPQMTIPELADTLTRAFARDVELRFLEGWRIEEMAAHLAKTMPAEINARAFQDIAQRKLFIALDGFDFLASLPPDVSLEGYLFPDTYRVPLDEDAASLIDRMLENFGRRVTPAMRQAYGIQGLSLREAVTLASIVEREAVVPSERPLIAGVFYNRLELGMKLEADPTTQYALGYQSEDESWWKSPLTLDDLQVNSPYNTYAVEGLPPSPIANPGLSSLQAVAEPAESEFLFFVVDCTADRSGTHVFSATFDEHVGKVERCR